MSQSPGFRVSLDRMKPKSTWMMWPSASNRMFHCVCPWPAAGSRPSSSQSNSAQNCAGIWGMPLWCNCHAPGGSNRAGRAVIASSPGVWIQRCWPLVQSCCCRPKSRESYMAWSTGLLAPVPKWTAVAFNTWKANSSCRRSSPHLTMTDRSPQLGRRP